MHVEGVLIVGGGYAGLHAARSASRAGSSVTVLNRTERHDFVTRLAAVAGGTDPIDDASCGLSEFGHDTIIGSVISVSDGSVELEDGRTVTADSVVVCAGAKPSIPPVDGIEQALVLRTAGDAVKIRNSLDEASALVVIGGGATGVQLAGAAASAHPDLDVCIIDAGERLVQSMSSELSVGVQRILEDRGVRVLVDTDVEEISPDGVVVGDERLAGVVVWAGGFEARADELGVDVSADGRILVDDHLRVMGMTTTFAAGDIAAHLDADGTFLPMSAQIAVQAGVVAGRNAASVLSGSDLDAAQLVQRGWVIDLGGRRGVAEFGPIKLAAPFVDVIPSVLHQLIDVKTIYGMAGFDGVRTLTA